MPDWIFWALFGWLMFAVVGRRRDGCGRRHRRAALERRHHPESIPGSAPAELPLHRPSREEREERLRARYVAGELSVDQYERALDELYRRR